MTVVLFLAYQATRKSLLSKSHSFMAFSVTSEKPTYQSPPFLGTVRWKCRAEHQYPEHMCVVAARERGQKRSREGVSYLGNFSFNCEYSVGLWFQDRAELQNWNPAMKDPAPSLELLTC